MTWEQGMRNKGKYRSGTRVQVQVQPLNSLHSHSSTFSWQSPCAHECFTHFLPPHSLPFFALRLTCSSEQSASRFSQRFVQLGEALRSLWRKVSFTRPLTLFPVYLSCIPWVLAFRQSELEPSFVPHLIYIAYSVLLFVHVPSADLSFKPLTEMFFLSNRMDKRQGILVSVMPL